MEVILPQIDHEAIAAFFRSSFGATSVKRLIVSIDDFEMVFLMSNDM